MQLNKVTLVGELNDDPQLRSDADGVPYGLLSLGTSESWTDQVGRKNTVTAWHRVRVLNDDILKTVKEHLKKGSRVLVEGSLQYARAKQEDANDIVISEVVILPKKGALYLMDKTGVTSSCWSKKATSVIGYAALFLAVSAFLSVDLYAVEGELLFGDVWTKLENTLVGGFLKIAAIVALGSTCYIGATKGNYAQAGISGGMLAAGIYGQDWINTKFTLCM